jgi:hypothetical protein
MEEIKAPLQVAKCKKPYFGCSCGMQALTTNYNTLDKVEADLRRRFESCFPSQRRRGKFFVIDKNRNIYREVVIS